MDLPHWNNRQIKTTHLKWKLKMNEMKFGFTGWNLFFFLLTKHKKGNAKKIDQ